MTDVVVYSDLGRYGAGRVMATIASGLARDGAAVEVVTFTAEAAHHPLLDPAWRLTVLDASAAPWQMLLWRYLRRVRPSAVLLADHRFAAAAALVARLACPSSNIVVVLHCDPPGILTGGRHMTAARLAAWRALLALSLRAATMLVAVSDGVRDQTARWLGMRAGRIATIHNPVLSSALYRAAEEPAGHPWFDRPDCPVVLGVGRLSHEKDWPTLLRAFAKVRKRLAARLVLLGEGPERAGLERLTEALGLRDDVLLAGEVANPFAFMARASVLAHPSIAEGLCDVLIEALSLNVPVVATNCPFGPSDILENGRWGRLVPVRDAAAMAGGLLDALGEGRPPAGSQDAMWARFSVEAAMSQYRELLFGRGRGQASDQRVPP